MFRILVIEDDPSVRRLMEKVLRDGGYEPLCAGDGIEALELLDHYVVDLAVVDVMMPRMDGYEFTLLMRQTKQDLPILMVTAKEQPADKKRGFLVGTDDYMVKPVDEEELLLRIAALLRRARIAREHMIRVGNTVLNYDAHTVAVGDKVQSLPAKEFFLLYKLLSYPDHIFTRRHLMDEIWDMDSDSDERTVDVHINRLRDRFRDCDDFEIKTIRGLGYKAVRLDLNE